MYRRVYIIFRSFSPRTKKNGKKKKKIATTDCRTVILLSSSYECIVCVSAAAAAVLRAARMTVITVYERQSFGGWREKIIYIYNDCGKEVDLGPNLWRSILLQRIISCVAFTACARKFPTLRRRRPGPDFRSSGIADARSTLMRFPVYTLPHPHPLTRVLKLKHPERRCPPPAIYLSSTIPAVKGHTPGYAGNCSTGIHLLQRHDVQWYSTCKRISL